MCTIGENEAHARGEGKQLTFVAERVGELLCYSNDWPPTHANNADRANVDVCRSV